MRSRPGCRPPDCRSRPGARPPSAPSEEARTASAAKDGAAQAAEEAARRTFPVSVFVSRKTQRLYVRKGNHPVFEGPVAIRDAQAPIGTFVFTAVDRRGRGRDALDRGVHVPQPDAHRARAETATAGPAMPPRPPPT